MNIVAVNNLGQDTDGLSKALAAALGKTLYEARSRLGVPGGGPSVVAVFREAEKVEESAENLRSGGFEVVVLWQEEVETDGMRFLARSFVFTKESLRLESRQGQHLTLHYNDIRLVLYGSGITVHTENELVKERTFSLGRAIMTQGLMMTKGTKREVETINQSRERFLYLYVPHQRTVVLRENALQYDSLGKSLQPSRSENFSYVIAELKQQIPHVMFDDRLLNSSSQVQMLGPFLSPEEHLDIATSLLAKVLLQP